ncbi:MAG: hypothetical protein AUK48_03955 [Oscillatoriales cyanobacterium CG2_30_44_21]|nr:MAG: hypothetical protein AUK48_03955 [Oscillatoriales cyanobacterium CG2_30_44_21]
MQKYSNKKKLVSLVKTKKFFLIAIASVSAIAMGASLLLPNFKNRPKFQLPEQISLPDLNFQSSNKLNNSNELNNSNISSIRQYIYTFSDDSLKQELRIDTAYILSSATVPSSLSVLAIKYPSKNIETRLIEGLGYFALFTYEQRAYLAACINPRGGSTVTLEQFNNNRYKYDISPERVARYLIGVADLRDDRCILTALSIALDSDITPQNKEMLEPIYQKLQRSWSNWFANWQSNFPEN